ncbi:PHP domain-containing protein [Endomicrobium proavitum]|uniref:PHP family metal-dependent phosphoesteraseputative metal-dependent phosphoesterase n=1 Tax=Endomicrobium proavitum TaxID=1408281 RepID=A0A0G3WJT0_9BACT|nr:PHP domain-containing protein [Endomicrobium proavitum]AKL97754.1 PHP family metal-dependent phosphoesteraseputative metal-dependent phosphoesterase [Endomicrobium proavitum]
MSEFYVDLHIHTHYSDGVLTPAEVVERAKKLKLAAISITDHDSVEGIEEAVSAAAGTNLEVIAGIELSSQADTSPKSEMHILGYYINYKSESFRAALEVFKKARLERAYKILEKLKENGIVLKNESFITDNNKKSVGRLHFAKALIEEGFVGSIQEAFQRYLAEGKPAYVPKFHISANDAVKLIKSVGGVAVMAHPYYAHYNDRAMLDALIKSGLDGLEAWHIKHPESAVKKFLSLTQELGLIATGGSDCHGPYKNEPPIIGRVKVPYSVIENLEKAKERQSVK